jgi:SAM-dependent methyltransferase
MALQEQDAERERLRVTFNGVAGSYQQARPGYPGELFDELVTAAGLSPGARMLEVGCATGKATLPLARRGFRVTCVEPGPDLAAAARRNLVSAGLDAEVVEARFEDWPSPPGEPFDLVFAATAWHWVDPAVRYRLAWQALRPGGHLAFWGATQVFPDRVDPFFREIQAVYDEIGDRQASGLSWPKSGDLEEQTAEIEASGLFAGVRVRHFEWAQFYDTEGYLALLDTFSNHILMERWKRERLYRAVREGLARRPGGKVLRHWGAVLHVARRLDQPSSAPLSGALAAHSE